MPSYRSTYHHGDARSALIGAALNQARLSGPQNVTLRAAARDVGITPAAVYRHFATVEELLATVKGRALVLLADRLDAASTASGDPAPANGFHTSATAGRSHIPAGWISAAVARAARVRAVAENYLAFARDCPGLFATACHGGPDALRDLVTVRLAMRPCPAIADGLPDPFLQPGAGLAVWSALHGVALLVAGGSLRAVSEDLQRTCLTQVLDIVLSGMGLDDDAGRPVTHRAPL